MEKELNILKFWNRMGLQVLIDILYLKNIDIKLYVEILFNIGWSIDDNGKIIYLINDDFEWENEELNKKDLIINLLYERFLSNKIFGFVLKLFNFSGGLFYFLFEKNEVMILLNINRIKFKEIEFIDYFFYFDKLYLVIKGFVKINYCDII